MTDSIKLHYHLSADIEPNKPPIVLLHGLFGSWENLGLAARALSERGHCVIGVDARNHGKSPHTPKIDYPSMASDTLTLMAQLGVSRFSLLGHSMGGKTAMLTALQASEQVDKVCIVDIAPRPYERGHDAIFEAMQALDLHTLSSRSQADQQLSQRIDEASIRSFLLKNLYRDSEKRWQWRLNLDALYQGYPAIIDWPETHSQFRGQTLVIRGGASDYVTLDDQAVFMRYFPALKAKTIAEANHWPHAAKPTVFQKIVGDFFG